MGNMLHAYLKSLKARHDQLDRAIDRGLASSIELQHLKRLRLRLRDEIARFGRRSTPASH
ncbi:MAG: DUF465 domain-containing protein [Sphingomonas sp.]|nr:DUF465 domain-containing protein [Sphingomonas sp.]